MKIFYDQFPSEKAIEILSNAENITFGSDNNNFINDLNFIQEFRGQINKQEVITWLVTNRGFRMQESYDPATHTILDNDFKISIGCIFY